MPIPAALDFDRVAKKALVELHSAVSGWLEGRPLEEGALLNRLTQAFAKRGRTDYGLKEPVQIDKVLYSLHRKGPKQTDLYGADLAITVDVPTAHLTKTALLQLKASSAYRVQLERRQLEDAKTFAAGWPNSFVMAVDRIRGGVRIAAAEPLLKECGEDEFHGFDATTWNSASEWIHKWLSCDLGAAGKPEEPGSLEGELARHVPADAKLPGTILRRVEPDAAGTIPARAWLYLRFVLVEPGRNPRRRTPFG